MTPAQLIAYLAFMSIASVTPGPNNTMLMASGANFGLKRTAPHMAGVVLGFGFLLGCVALGLGALVTAVPVLHAVLRYGGCAYLLWLAWKIATARSIGGAEAARPLRFWEVVAFQWINPKAWVAGIGALTAYSVSDDYTTSVIAVTLAFAATGILSASSWVLFGAGMRRVLSDPGRVRPFNWTMAALLAASVAPIFWE